jgi:hypothetical protein
MLDCTTQPKHLGFLFRRSYLIHTMPQTCDCGYLGVVTFMVLGARVYVLPLF